MGSIHKIYATIEAVISALDYRHTASHLLAFKGNQRYARDKQMTHNSSHVPHAIGRKYEKMVFGFDQGIERGGVSDGTGSYAKYGKRLEALECGLRGTLKGENASSVLFTSSSFKFRYDCPPCKAASMMFRTTLHPSRYHVT
jgi:hypothetical protein